MFPRSPILVLTFLLFLPAARVDGAGDSPHTQRTQQNFTRQVGGSVIFHVDFPKGFIIEEMFLRTALRKEAVAIWQPGKTLNVISGKYGGRVTFSEETHSFNISSLRVADGERYEVSVSQKEPAETVTNAYRLSVFNINVTANKFDNSSCSVTLVCQAGMGPGVSSTYRWMSSASKATLRQGSQLQVMMDPVDKYTSYTCIADGKGFESSWIISPYEQFCRSGVAGLFKPGFLAKAFLLTVLITIVTLP